jgi:hypothetical protein
VYLVYLLMLWLCVRVFRRLKAEARQQKMMYEAKAEGVLQDVVRRDPRLSLP